MTERSPLMEQDEHATNFAIANPPASYQRQSSSSAAAAASAATTTTTAAAAAGNAGASASASASAATGRRSGPPLSRATSNSASAARLSIPGSRRSGATSAAAAASGGGGSGGVPDEPLPSYETVTGNAPPPTYESLFGRIRDERDRSGIGANFILRVVILLIGTIGVSVMGALFLGIPISMIVIGAVKWDAPCDTDHFRIFLIVGGTCGLATNLYSLCCKKKRRDENGELIPEEPTLLGRLMTLTEVFELGWFIVGNVWVYSYDTGDDYANCDKTLFLFTFWIVTTFYLILGGILVLFCLLICVLSCYGRSVRQQQAADDDAPSEHGDDGDDDDDRDDGQNHDGEDEHGSPPGSSAGAGSGRASVARLPEMTTAPLTTNGSFSSTSLAREASVTRSSVPRDAVAVGMPQSAPSSPNTPGAGDNDEPPPPSYDELA
ncbi:hypothetical protein CAOG_06475 [Capsaspora owczarzaki ATCC 30864]|uniref:Transmembrane protein n=1 Tax=Capsaspora owczarzaki (strain ATCC 30864) TaxID=595528 RepID=A0A0D2UM21_CAPO3|nr:hypothetical protein CAOG_06475 [Capsaspora owczarzaki ATCC 30864]KJE96106.1 hypothetical protein CAOG_006475 [Capsaspora owczarzaki ATCC 30864]|eukprot:XP_004345224.2 hypothetical protein CAOG_06475 [Capsaspora owczarzaki ATCC 30864]